MTLLDSLCDLTTIVADTGDIGAIAQYTPQDATTNPSLIKKAMQQPEYRDLVEEAQQYAAGQAEEESARAERFVEKLLVNFGQRILEVVPGRVSTEVDARLSYDTAGTLAKARRLIELYRAEGIDTDRVLIKIASTWEGIRAAEELEREGVHCNLTLLFCSAQAIACADAKVQLISPFVGRIYDWYKADRGVEDIPVEEDPGVISVASIFDTYKAHGVETEIMGASFRKAEQVLALAGCDLLTISPSILKDLQTREGTVERQLDASLPKHTPEDLNLSEAEFRWRMCQDPMATEKLADGIRRFHADGEDLVKIAREQIS